MGQRTNGVAAARAPEHVAHEIDAIRRDLDRVVAELDRRRHELTDWRLQLRRHKRGLALTVLGAAVPLPPAPSAGRPPGPHSPRFSLTAGRPGSPANVVTPCSQVSSTSGCFLSQLAAASSGS